MSKSQGNRKLQRGDIFYIIDDPNNPPVGAEIWPDRAGLIVSNNAICGTSNCVKVVYLYTTNRKDSPTHIKVTSGSKQATAMCEQIHSVDVSRLTSYFGHISDEEMEEIDAALMFSLGINTGTNPQGIFKKWERYVKTYRLPPLNQKKLQFHKQSSNLAL